MHKRNFTIDFIRTIAIISVVLIHTTSKTIELSGFDLTRIPLTFFLNQSARFAVPVFFLISGYLLTLTYKGTIKEFYKKRAFRLVIPYTIWELVYYVGIEKHSFKSIFSFLFASDFFSGAVEIQMYFVPTIFLLYLLFPILKKYQKLFLRYLPLITLGEFILLFYDYYFFPPLFIPLRYTLTYAYIFTLGIIAVPYTDQIKNYVRKHTVTLTLLLISSLLIMCYESWNLYYQSYNVNYVTGQSRVTTYIYALCLCALWFTYIKLDRFAVIIKKLSSLAFFVFFVHVIFIHLFWKIIGSYLFSKTAGHIVEDIAFDIGVFLLVTLSSFITAYIVSYIPKLRTLLGITP